MLIMYGSNLIKKIIVIHSVLTSLPHDAHESILGVYHNIMSIPLIIVAIKDRMAIFFPNFCNKIL